MNTSTVDIKRNCINRLSEHFDTFREEEIGGRGIAFAIMPLKQDVPLIKQASYNRKTDIFEIVFEYTEEVIYKDSGFVTFIEERDESLVGIRIKGIRSLKVKEVVLRVVATLDKVIQEAQLEIKGDLESIARLSIEKRKVDFLKDVINEEIPKVVSSKKESKKESIRKEREENLRAYDKCKTELYKKYAGKYVIIAKGKVQAIRKSFEDAKDVTLDTNHRFIFKVEPKKKIRGTLRWPIKKK